MLSLTSHIPVPLRQLGSCRVPPPTGAGARCTSQGRRDSPAKQRHNIRLDENDKRNVEVKYRYLTVCISNEIISCSAILFEFMVKNYCKQLPGPLYRTRLLSYSYSSCCDLSISVNKENRFMFA